MEPKMVVTRTPLRISFAGGGSDLASFCQREYGAVLSTAIAQYVYVTVKRHGKVFNEPIRLNYSKSERVNRIDEIDNNIARECLRLLKVEPPIHISTVGDLPASTGLGSSSAFAVGLLNALHAFHGERVSAGQLAEEAAEIEIQVLKQPIGKQDQYAAAFGGFNFLRFNPDSGVTVEPVRTGNGTLNELFRYLKLFWTGHQHDASSVLKRVSANIPRRVEHLRQMRAQAHQLHELITQSHWDVGELGKIIDQGWHLKRELANCVSNNSIDEWYERAKKAGAEGGKLCGAGGGGFLLFVVKPDKQASVKEALRELPEVAIEYEAYGSRVLLPNGH